MSRISKVLPGFTRLIASFAGAGVSLFIFLRYLAVEGGETEIFAVCYDLTPTFLGGLSDCDGLIFGPHGKFLGVPLPLIGISYFVLSVFFVILDFFKKRALVA